MLVQLKRKVISRLNHHRIFWESNPEVFLIVAGYTRSGTTFLADLLSYILKARLIYEPLNPLSVQHISFFHERESYGTFENSPRHQQALAKIFSPGFKGNRHTNRGGLLFYKGRMVKIVRGNFYIEQIAKILSNNKVCIIIRHPYACISSRIDLGWQIPDQSKCIEDIWPKLSKKQKEVIKKTDSNHERLAISWCLDNMSLLCDSTNISKKYVFYEDLVLNTEDQVKEILSFVGKDTNQYENRIKKEIFLQNSKGTDKMDVIFKWKKKLSQTMINDIKEVIKIFYLEYLYDPKTHMPTDFLRNSAAL